MKTKSGLYIVSKMNKMIEMMQSQLSSLVFKNLGRPVLGGELTREEDLLRHRIAESVSHCTARMKACCNTICRLFERTSSDWPMDCSEMAKDPSPIQTMIEDNNPEFLEIIRGYASDLPRKASILALANDMGDWKTLEAEAHRLKNGGTFGYPILSELGTKLETAVGARKLREVSLLITCLGPITRRIKAGLSSAPFNPQTNNGDKS